MIEEAYAEPLKLERLAAEAGMERFAFAHAFRRVVGRPPYAHLTERRLRAAAELLRDSDRTVLEISLAIGFPLGQQPQPSVPTHIRSEPDGL
jgi:AraC-like DNA-binding protein